MPSEGDFKSKCIVNFGILTLWCYCAFSQYKSQMIIMKTS